MIEGDSNRSCRDDMIRNKTIRLLVWFLGVGLIAGGVIALRNYNPIRGVGALALGIVAVLVAFQTLKCRNCGKKLRQISAGLTHCPYCGTPYAKTEEMK